MVPTLSIIKKHEQEYLTNLNNETQMKITPLIKKNKKITW